MMEAERERRLLIRERRNAGLPQAQKKPWLVRAIYEPMKIMSGRRMIGGDYSKVPE